MQAACSPLHDDEPQCSAMFAPKSAFCPAASLCFAQVQLNLAHVQLTSKLKLTSGLGTVQLRLLSSVAFFHSSSDNRCMLRRVGNISSCFLHSHHLLC